MFFWDLVASVVAAGAVTAMLGLVLGWRRRHRDQWKWSGGLIFVLVFAGAWALGVWLAPIADRPFSGQYWATFLVCAGMVGLAVAAVLPQRVLQQTTGEQERVLAARSNARIGGLLYWLVLVALVVMIVRYYTF